MIRSAFRVLVASLLTGLLAGHGAGAAAEEASLCTVEIYGDSIMASNGSAETPAKTLQRIRPNLLVLSDHSVPGTSLDKLATAFFSQSRTAHYVIIENGVIDAWDGQNINTVMYEYAAIVKKVRDEGRVPLLTGFSHQASGGVLGYPALWRRDFYDSVIKAVATNANVAFADWGSVPFYGAVDLLDFVHPNQDYSNRLIGRLALTLDPLTVGCTATLAPPT